MKNIWIYYVIGTILCWGAYVPIIHLGQLKFITEDSPVKGSLRAFMFVGVAYFIMAIVVPCIWIFVMKNEPAKFPTSGMSWSTFAGALGAAGALGVILALNSGGKPYTVPPLVFAGAPIMSVFVGMLLDPPKAMPKWPFFAGIVLAAAGAALVLVFKPAGSHAKPAKPDAQTTQHIEAPAESDTGTSLNT